MNTTFAVLYADVGVYCLAVMGSARTAQWNTLISITLASTLSTPITGTRCFTAVLERALDEHHPFTIFKTPEVGFGHELCAAATAICARRAWFAHVAGITITCALLNTVETGRARHALEITTGEHHLWRNRKPLGVIAICAHRAWLGHLMHLQRVALAIWAALCHAFFALQR